MTEQQEKSDSTLKDYAEMVSGLGTGYGVLKGLAGRPAPMPTVPAPYVGPAVGMPVPGGPVASQALRAVTGAIPEVMPEVGAVLPEAAEVIGLGLAGAGEVAGATALAPILGPLALAGVAGGGLYYLGKKLLERNPDDRVAKSIVNHEVVKHERAKVLANQMFDHQIAPATPVYRPVRPPPVDINKSELDYEPTFNYHPQPVLTEPMHFNKKEHHKHKHNSKHKKKH